MHHFSYLIPPSVFYPSILPAINTKEKTQAWVLHLEILIERLEFQRQMLNDQNIIHPRHSGEIREQINQLQYYLADLANLEL